VTSFTRRTLLIGAAALLASPARADPSAAQMDAASETVLAFLKALRKQDLDGALTQVDAPFVAEDAQILATKDDVRAYLTEMLADVDPGEMPNAVLSVLDYEQSRPVTTAQTLKLRDAVLNEGDLLVGIGRDGLSRGVLLVRASAETPMIVGVGY
jgi:hypothetical protein